MELTSPALSRTTYLETVRRFFAIYSALEERLEPHLPALDRVGLEWAARRKTAWLRRDLQALGDVHEECLSTVAPECVPRLETLPAALGCCYVLEGATLGGQVIGRHVRQQLALGPENGASFFASYGALVPQKWQAFCVSLERGLSESPARAEAIAAAEATFGLFLEQFGDASLPTREAQCHD